LRPRLANAAPTVFEFPIVILTDLQRSKDFG
jgi:hypothetical protein